MKKHLNLLWLVCLALVLTLVACGESNTTPEDTTPASTTTETQATTDATDITIEGSDTETDTTLQDTAVETDTYNVSTEVEADTQGETVATDDSTVAESSTETEAETEAKTEAETETETEAKTEAETQQPKCEYTSASASQKTVGTRRLDSFKHQSFGTDYLAGSVANLPNWSGVITVDETTGTFEIRGWVGFNFTDYEFAWRIGTNSETPYRNWSVITEPGAPDIAAVKNAAKSEGYDNAMRFVYYLGTDGFKSGDSIHLLIKNKSTGTVYCFAEFIVNVNKPAVDPSEALKKYELGLGSNMDMSAYDPITNKETPTAPHDDATLKLWFDHLTEKVARYDTSGKDSGASSYTIQMAKNEMEGCHFYLYSPTNRKITIKYSQFENANGEKLETELGVEFYIEDGYINYKDDYPHYKTFNIGDKDISGEKTVDVYADAVIPYESYVRAGYGGDEGGYYMDATGTWQAMEYGEFVNIGKYTSKFWDLDNYPYSDTVRGFVVQATTTANTTPGAYKATVEIYDYDTGECIKMANVYTYVYNVTLSEETAMDTAIGIWGDQYSATYDKFGGWNGVQVTKALADFMLKYRMTPNVGLWVLDNVLCPDGDNTWLENPRVTTLKIYNEDMYNRYKDDPILADKMFYYGQDEPGIPRNQWRDFKLEDGTQVRYFDEYGILSLLGVAEEAKMLQSWGWEDYRLVIPFERNNNLSDLSRYYSIMKDSYIPNLGWVNVEYSLKNNGNPAGAMELYNKYKAELKSSRDMVDFLDNYITVWTYIPSGSAPRELQGGMIKEQYYMQDVKLDPTFGEFADRMSGLQTRGDELWSYVACEPKWDAPYQNILLFNDGTEARTLFWTNYMLGQTGFLYWREDYYSAVEADTSAMRNPFSKTGPGDGILVYPGAIYGQLDPIPSIRFINMRDGIEDYQLLTMLETAKGEAYTNELVSHVVTSTVTFTRDGDVVNNVRSFLLRQLEAAQ